VIVLVGFMGAGKTTVGHLLAARLGLPFADSDQVIEQRARRPVRQIFAEDGEPTFRALEHQVIAELLDGPALVLALGGGAAEHPLTRALLTRRDDPPRPPRSWGDPSSQVPLGGDPAPRAPLGNPPEPGGSLPPGLPWPWVAYLQVGYEQAMLRVGGDTDPQSRPLLARPDLAALYQRRLPLYAAVAAVTIPTDGRSPAAVGEDVLARLVRVSAGRAAARHQPAPMPDRS
jgi:shikimate kinase